MVAPGISPGIMSQVVAGHRIFSEAHASIGAQREALNARRVEIQWESCYMVNQRKRHSIRKPYFKKFTFCELFGSGILQSFSGSI